MATAREKSAAALREAVKHLRAVGPLLDKARWNLNDDDQDAAAISEDGGVFMAQRMIDAVSSELRKAADRLSPPKKRTK